MNAFSYFWQLFIGGLILIGINLPSFAQESLKVGELWIDTNGEVINAHGGGILEYQGKYYWYGEHRDAGKKQYATWQGVRCYSSDDLIQWRNEGIVMAVSSDSNSEITAGCNIERPKVIYNSKSQKFVMWFHLELKGQGYGAAKTAVAIADQPNGPFTFVNSFRPNAGQWPLNFERQWRKSKTDEKELKWWSPEWYTAVREGLFVRRDFEKGQMARDMALFVDDNGKAYHIHSAEENLTLHISELTDDYLDFTGKYITVEPAGHNEAPALFKKDGYYYMVTSGCTGWDPNAARSFRATDMLGTWESLGNPCQGSDANLTFRSQSTFILPLGDSWLFMADRWNPTNISDSRYIWLPLTVEDGKPVIRWKNEWTLQELQESDTE